MRIVRFPVLPARRCARAASRAWASVFTGPAGETTIVCAASVEARSSRQALMPICLTHLVGQAGYPLGPPAGSSSCRNWRDLSSAISAASARRPGKGRILLLPSSLSVLFSASPRQIDSFPGSGFPTLKERSCEIPAPPSARLFYPTPVHAIRLHPPSHHAVPLAGERNW